MRLEAIVTHKGTEKTSKAIPTGVRGQQEVASTRLALADRLQRELIGPLARRPVRTLPHAQVELDTLQRDYNETRPHSKLGWLMPSAYGQALAGQTDPPPQFRSRKDPQYGWTRNEGRVSSRRTY